MTARAFASRLALVLLAIPFAAGCGRPALPFLPAFYTPLKATRLPESLPPIAVYSLADERGAAEPTLISEFASISGHRHRDHATEPISDGATRAVVEGFRVRRFPVVDMTAYAQVTEGGILPTVPMTLQDRESAAPSSPGSLRR